MPATAETNPGIRLITAYRNRTIPTIFAGEMFTAWDANLTEYVCCAADPETLPGHYIAAKIPADYGKYHRRDEISFWTLLMTSDTGEWFTAGKLGPTEFILFLEPQAGSAADSGFIPQPPPVPHDPADKAYSQQAVKDLVRHAQATDTRKNQ